MADTKEAWKENLLHIFPPKIGAALAAMEPSRARRLEEIRLRACKPLMAGFGSESLFVQPDGTLASSPLGAYMVTQEDCASFFSRAANHSVYAFDDEIRRGYITVRGGYRIGIAGKAVIEDGRVRTITCPGGFNVRIAREIHGAANAVMPYIVQKRRVAHTLVLSPPQMGKTTMLRDIARQLAGIWGFKTGIADERSEIAGCWNGVPQFDVGIQADVLDGCPKAEGIQMLIRGMAPEVVITDEIGREEDAQALEDARNAGVSVIASAHAGNISEMLMRPVLRDIAAKRIFSVYIVLGGAAGRVLGIYGADLKEMIADAELA